MLTLRPNCECCDRDLPADSPDARICTFECTFCMDCAEHHLQHTCPNCHGELVRRPRRPAAALARHPASTTRTHAKTPRVPTSGPENNPRAVVQRQLDAYNAKNLDAWLATYAADATQHTLHGPLLASGHAALRERIQTRFAEPNLHAHLLERLRLGPFVVDLERVTRNLPQGRGEVEMLCVYEVRNGRIQAASFAMGEARQDGSA